MTNHTARVSSNVLGFAIVGALIGVTGCIEPESARGVEDPESDRDKQKGEPFDGSDDGGSDDGGSDDDGGADDGESSDGSDGGESTGGAQDGPLCRVDGQPGCFYDEEEAEQAEEPADCADEDQAAAPLDPNQLGAPGGDARIDDGDALAAEGDAQAGTSGPVCLPAVPAGAVALGDTGQRSIRWMEQFRQSSCKNPFAYLPSSLNQLTGPQITQIANNCNAQPTELARLRCAAEAVDFAVGGTEDSTGEYVCRHHMGSLYRVLLAMGYPGTNEGSFTHAWNEVQIDTDGDGIKDTIVVLDSFNGIYYTAPK